MVKRNQMTPYPTEIVGIDCAVDPSKRGIAVGCYDGTTCRISLPGIKTDSEIATCISQLSRQSSRILLAIDAPLGWPVGLGIALSTHKAGLAIPADANTLFRRFTDQFIKEKTNKQSLDVGADRIARTAHAALGIISAISRTVPLAWTPGYSERIAVIEVYPAATLRSYKLPDTGYKDKKQRPIREEILLGLTSEITLPTNTEPILANADTLDAVVCVLAGMNFLKGNCYQPPSDYSDLARKEGWIWVRK